MNDSSSNFKERMAATLKAWAARNESCLEYHLRIAVEEVTLEDGEARKETWLLLVLVPAPPCDPSTARGEDSHSPDSVQNGEPDGDVPSKGPDESPRRGLQFYPGAFEYPGRRHLLSGKPLKVLKELAEARWQTLTL